MRKRHGLDFPGEICPAKCQCHPLPKTENRSGFFASQRHSTNLSGPATVSALDLKSCVEKAWSSYPEAVSTRWSILWLHSGWGQTEIGYLRSEGKAFESSQAQIGPQSFLKEH